MLNNKMKYALLIALAISLSLSSCKQYDNFTTFFNTYYNANKLIKEAEEEFEYQEEKKRVLPRVIIPQSNLVLDAQRQSGMPPFMEEFLISRVKRQPVAVKLDSVLIKGSKILSYHPKSNYVMDVLYLMAKTYFYREEWLPSQIKCSELIDKFPDGDLSPDAHLLLAQNLIVQQKYYAGKIMLSRTVDIAWQKKRYDILSDAFRIEAELALFQNDLEGALKPYLQAVAQSDDGYLKSKWQIELATLLFRLRMFERAEKEFANALKYNPDYLGIFEANLYQAASMIRLKRYAEAEKILDRLDNDGKFTEWKPYVLAQRMQIARMKEEPFEIEKLERTADSLYNVHQATAAFAYERGMDFYQKNDFNTARMYFARARALRVPNYAQAEEMYQLLNSWDTFNKKTAPALNRISNKETLSDTSLQILSYDLFEMGRVQTQLKNKDSALYYYERAAMLSPEKDTTTARFMYVYSHFLKKDDLRKSDSLLQAIVDRYPRTQYGREAMSVLGYTNAFLQDSVAELYSSGSDLMKHGEYVFAVSQFHKIFEYFPDSRLSPRSLYNTGWIYEKNLNSPDSAFKYYSLLIERYPHTVYAKDVGLTVAYLTALNSGSPLPDSLVERQRVVYQSKPIPTNIEPVKAPAIEKKDKSDPTLEDFLSPTKLWERAKEMVNEPMEQIKDLQKIEIKDLVPAFKSDSTSSMPADSLKPNLPEKK